jgi:glucose dehydrogenase/uncharacterized cupin superfamily protein
MPNRHFLSPTAVTRTLVMALSAAFCVPTAYAQAVHPTKITAKDRHALTSPDVETAVTDGQVSKNRVMGLSADQHFKSGLYSSQVEKAQVESYPVDEFMYFLEGGVTLTSADGAVMQVGAGDAVFLPKGWKGLWDTTGYKKFYVVYTPAVPRGNSDSRPLATQVADGAAGYSRQCAACHGEQLQGVAHAPALRGNSFLTSWSGKSSRNLYSRIISTMPLTHPGSLEPAMALDITVFILSANAQAISSSAYGSADQLDSVPIARSEGVPAESGSARSDWAYFGGSKRFDRYSPLSQIDAGNVGALRPAWTRPGLDPSIHAAFPDLAASNYLRGTPILANGVLYAPDAVGLIEAFDPATGATRWIQKPFKATLQEAAGESTRTVDFWQEGRDARIIAVRGEYLYALDASNGDPITSFGEAGRVSLNRRTPDGAAFFSFNGPIIVGDVIIVGGNGGGNAGGGYGDGGNTIESTPEDIRGYDVRTGRKVWTFHVMPERGDPGSDSWGKSRDRTGNMAAWAPLSADESRGIVYVPLSAPTNSEYGGHRPGNNLYSCSLVALNAKTGKRLWDFQLVHHDLWDYDTSAPPTIADITVDGRTIPAVIQPSKTGFLYVFNRVTGKPVWPIEERPVPQSTVPGEHTSATQPFPTKPPAFDRQGITDEDLIDYTPEFKARARQFLADYDIVGGLFAPPSIPTAGKKGTITLPGGWGAGSWNTGAFDPQTHRYYAVSMTMPGTYNLKKATDPRATMPYEGDYASGAEHDDTSSPSYGVGPAGLPLLKGPYGRITAFDMDAGEKLWTVANGDGPRNHPLLKSLNLPPLGTMGKPAALVTKSLLFLGEASDAVMGGAEAGIAGPAKFRAYDKDTGAALWETTLPAGTTGGPITYLAGGKQFILVPIGGDQYGSGWMALALGARTGASR